MRTRLLLAVLAVALTASTGTAWAAFNFTDPVALPKSLPDAKGNTEMQGGEPSLAFDPSGDGHLYSVAPGGQGPGGVNFWGSADNGVTWSYIGSPPGFDAQTDLGRIALASTPQAPGLLYAAVQSALARLMKSLRDSSPCQWTRSVEGPAGRGFSNWNPTNPG